MSRIGKKEIAVPSGVKVAVAGQEVSVEGPKGKLSYALPIGLTAKVNGSAISIVATADLDSISVKYGTARAHINNMVQGVAKGWKKNLELVGVGFAAKLQGGTLVLSCGYSHDVELQVPAGVKCVVGKTNIDLESDDKHKVGQFASIIRKVQPPEPYLGKGIKYSDEVVRRKAGKTGKK